MTLEREKGGEREGGRKREREREKLRCEREALIGHPPLGPPHIPQPGVKPTTQVCVMTGDRTYNLLVYG